MHKVVFNCNQTQKQGFGHFFRCLNFARHMKLKKNFQISFIGMFSNFSLSILEKESFNVVNLKSNDDLFSNLVKYDYLITDRYEINQNHLDNIANNHEIKSIIIDDFNELNFSNQDLVINFRVGINHYSYSSNKVALGEKFFIYKPELLNIREKYNFSSNVKKVLFFGTGTNKSNNNFNNLPSYLINQFPKIEILHVTSQPLNIKSNRYIAKPYNGLIENYLEKVDATINGGGLIKYETSFCGIPSASLSTTNKQHEDTLLLEQEGLLYNLGNQLTENKIKVENRIKNFINNPKIRKTISNNGINFFTPKSVNNLINKIYEI